MSDAATLDLDDTTAMPHTKPQPVVTHDHAPMAKADQPQAGSSASLVHIIERIAFAPEVDLDRMERLLGFYERVKAGEAKAAYTAAMSAMQPELPTIEANGEIKHDKKLISKYAKWEDINDVIKPILAKHGFSLDFEPSQDDKGLSITAILEHVGGRSKKATLRLPLDTSGAKNNVQSIGSTVSYGKRYTAGLVLNITSRAPGDTDDDGKAAGAAAPITDEQAADIYHRIDEANASTSDFLTHFKIARIEDMPARDYDRAVVMLAKKKARQTETAS